MIGTYKKGSLLCEPPIPSACRKGDDTFDRVYGPKSGLEWEPASHMIGKAPDTACLDLEMSYA